MLIYLNWRKKNTNEFKNIQSENTKKKGKKSREGFLRIHLEDILPEEIEPGNRDHDS